MDNAPSLNRIRWFFAIEIFASRNPPRPKESLASIELGGAPSWSLTGSGMTMSPTVAIEVTPIEHWLELEIGTTPTFAHHSTEWVTDLLFKKPWTLSKRVEFMFGVGPEWIHKRGTNSIGGEVALDFMFWPSARRRFGWYLEPAYAQMPRPILLAPGARTG